MVNEAGGRTKESSVMEARTGEHVFRDTCSWQVRMSTEKHLFGLVTWCSISGDFLFIYC